MRPIRVTVLLPDAENPYYEAMSLDAQAAASLAGVEVNVMFAGHAYFEQVRQIQAALQSPTRPDALAVMAVQEAALKSLAVRVLDAGIGWVCLNRRIENLEALRVAHPGLPVGVIAPDQMETGRIQARQVSSLLADGGHVLYVQGRETNVSAQQRARGFKEMITQRAGLDIVGSVDGNWNATDAQAAVERWMSMMLPAGLAVDAVVCQNDFMAAGVRAALRELAAVDAGMRHLLKVPVLGCDGVLAVGRRLVDDGEIASTVLLPTTTGPAIEAISAHFAGRAEFPAHTILAPSPYPDEGSMCRRWRHVA